MSEQYRFEVRLQAYEYQNWCKAFGFVIVDRMNASLTAENFVDWLIFLERDNYVDPKPYTPENSRIYTGTNQVDWIHVDEERIEFNLNQEKTVRWTMGDLENPEGQETNAVFISNVVRNAPGIDKMNYCVACDMHPGYDTETSAVQFIRSLTDKATKPELIRDSVGA